MAGEQIFNMNLRSLKVNILILIKINLTTTKISIPAMVVLYIKSLTVCISLDRRDSNLSESGLRVVTATGLLSDTQRNNWEAERERDSPLREGSTRCRERRVESPDLLK